MSPIVSGTNIYQLTDSFPKKETYGLASQICRAAVSVAANIAEGRSRASDKEFIRFIHISLGSLAELQTLLLISCNLSYISNDQYSTYEGDLNSIGKMLQGLKKKAIKS